MLNLGGFERKLRNQDKFYKNMLIVGCLKVVNIVKIYNTKVPRTLTQKPNKIQGSFINRIISKLVITRVKLTKTLTWRSLLSLVFIFSLLALLCRMLGARQTARFPTSILFCSAWIDTLARNFRKKRKVLRCCHGNRRQRNMTAIWRLWWLSRLKHLIKESWRRRVKRGSGSSRKNCLTRLQTSNGWASLSSSPNSIRSWKKYIKLN